MINLYQKLSTQFLMYECPGTCSYVLIDRKPNLPPRRLQHSRAPGAKYMGSGALYTRHFPKGPRESLVQRVRSGLVSTPCPKCSSLCCGCFVRRGYLFPRARTGVGSTQEACRGRTGILDPPWTEDGSGAEQFEAPRHRLEMAGVSPL